MSQSRKPIPREEKIPLTLSRRTFLGGMIGGSAAIAAANVLKPGHGAEASPKSKVVVIRNPKVMVDDKPQGDIAGQMLAESICALTGKTSSTAAWRSLFSPKEKVLIKINALFPPVTPSPPVVMAIVKGLKEAGLDENNVIIHDRRNGELVRAGFTINDTSTGVRCRGSEDYSPWMEAAPGLFRTRLCKDITDEVDAIINVPSLKVHHRSGVTLSMKNLLGCIPNASDTHGGGCPKIADISALDPVKKKTRLIIVDGVCVQYDRGPIYSKPFVWNYGGFLLSTDTVAADAVGADEILKKRHALGLEGPIRPSLIHIARAAELGLGVADLGKIDVVRIEKGK